jgi:hypothetical protein
MITNFKIFENKKLYEYVDNFIIVNNSIELCTTASFADSLSKKNILVRFDCFDFNENNEILKEIYGDNETFTREELDKLIFMTPMEFYNKHTELCTNLYERVETDSNNFTFTEGDGGWYPKMIKNCKRVLETIPFFDDLNKYNL